MKLQKQFLDHYLKGVDNGWENRSTIRMWVRNVDGTHVERDEKEWPLARTQWTKYYLDTKIAGFLTQEQPQKPGKMTYMAMGNGATFSTGPLEKDMEITGPLAAKLFISSTTTDTDLYLALRAFDPNGKEVTFEGAQDPYYPLSLGWLRASHRKLDEKKSKPYRPYHTHDELQPLEPESIYEVDVEIWPTSIVLPKGSRLALTVLGHDWEYDGVPDESRLLRPDNLRGRQACITHFAGATPEGKSSVVTVYTGGENSSYLLVPIIP